MIHVHPSLPNSTHDIYIYIYIFIHSFTVSCNEACSPSACLTQSRFMFQVHVDSNLFTFIPSLHGLSMHF